MLCGACALDEGAAPGQPPTQRPSDASVPWSGDAANPEIDAAAPVAMQPTVPDINIPVLPGRDQRPDAATDVTTDADVTEPEPAVPSHDSGAGPEPLPWLDASADSGPEDAASDASPGDASPPRDSGLDGSVDSADASDASPSLPSDDAGPSCEAQCAARGGICVDEQCVFDCSEPGACPFVVDCPDDFPCNVECGEDACAQTVQCPDEAWCSVECTGDRSCSDSVLCRGVGCSVLCVGEDSCQGTIGGGASDIVVECNGSGSCSDEVRCEASNCDITCSGPNSCQQVTTSTDAALLVCSGRQSCEDVDCNAGVCDIRCPGFGACDDVTCSAAVVSDACD